MCQNMKFIVWLARLIYILLSLIDRHSLWQTTVVDDALGRNLYDLPTIQPLKAKSNYTKRWCTCSNVTDWMLGCCSWFNHCDTQIHPITLRSPPYTISLSPPFQYNITTLINAVDSQPTVRTAQGGYRGTVQRAPAWNWPWMLLELETQMGPGNVGSFSCDDGGLLRDGGWWWLLI